MGNVDRVFDESRVLKDNAMLKHRPELFYEWDFEKNDELGLDVYEVSYGSHNKAWWVCGSCNSHWEAMVSNRARLHSGCPYCAGQKVNETNSLASIRPDIAVEWHPTKNGSDTPHDVTCGSGSRLYWWLGTCGHEWEASVNCRVSGKWGCPICSGHQVLTGFNDLWTTHPKVAKLLVNSDIGYLYSRGSNYRTDWKCPDCGTIKKNIMITTIVKQGLSCPACSDGKSFGEKFIYNLLKQNDIKFEYEKTFDWLKKKRYDFYLPELNWIIEVHGTQHSQESPFHKTGQSLKEVQANDKLKHDAAVENGIEKYIVVDAYESIIENIICSVEDSALNEILPIKNYDAIAVEASGSFLRTACELWKSGLQSTLEISKMLKIDRYTVTRYLKRGAKIGLCDYSVEAEQKKARDKAGLKRRKPVVQTDIEDNFIALWDAQYIAADALGLDVRSISQCRRNLLSTYAGFKWYDLVEYEREFGKIVHD